MYCKINASSEGITASIAVGIGLDGYKRVAAFGPGNLMQGSLMS